METVLFEVHLEIDDGDRVEHEKDAGSACSFKESYINGEHFAGPQIKRHN